MIVLFAVIGWIVGVLVSQVADAMPRLSVGSSGAAVDVSGGREPALVQWLAYLFSRERKTRSARPRQADLAVELLSAGLLACLWSAPLEPRAMISMTCLCIFLTLIAIVDLRYRVVPNVLVFPAMALTVLVRLASGGDALAVLVGGAFGFAIFAAVALVRPGELGGGDVKLATWIGFVFGFPNALWALMVGVFAGGAIAVVLLASHRGDSKSEMPYAPFLCLGALVALLYNPVPWLLYRLAGH